MTTTPRHVLFPDVVAAKPTPKIVKLADNKRVRECFADALAESSAPTPWRLGEIAGEIVDASGEQVCIIDQMAPETCTRIANLICRAVNACASATGGDR